MFTTDKRRRPSSVLIVRGVQVIACVARFVLMASPGHAADAVVTEDSPSEATRSFDWSGGYLGGNIGWGAGSSNFSARDNQTRVPDASGSFGLSNPPHLSDGTGSYFAGLQAGYSLLPRPSLLLGVEIDALFPNTLSGSQTFSIPPMGQASFEDSVLAAGSVRGRLGYVLDPWLLYGTGGFAWSYDELTLRNLSGVPAPENAMVWRLGWTLGAGIERPIAGNWTVKLEYQYRRFSNSTVAFPSAGQTVESDLALHAIQLGLNYHIGGGTELAEVVSKGPAPLELDWLALHGQSTFVGQYAFPFHAPYSGPNSLASNQARETWDATLYVGIRLWEGADFWINPELDQGFGLSDTFGLAGFPSGEAYKVGKRTPYVRIPRYFFRQVVNLGGEPQTVDADLNQFPRTMTSNRVALIVGKFAVTDVFDTNQYAHDPRTDFLNWALIDTGTFDYAADAWGYTYGAAAEWYHDATALRFGGFDLSVVPNSTKLDPSFDQFQLVAEIAQRFEILSAPGKVAITPWLSRGRMGNYNDAVRLSEMTGQPADIAAVREYRSRWGIAANAEQAVTPDWGLFLRTGFASPDVEPYEFTDIDRTVAIGTQFAGGAWSRPDDTVGIAGILNDISASHEAFLNAGGLGLLIGDGRLPHPGPEEILETYYCVAVDAWRVTFDYQFFNNPAYNHDRGPVSVAGLRLHSEF